MLVADTNDKRFLKARDAMRRLTNTDEGFNDILTWLNAERLRVLGQSAYSHNQTLMHREQGAVQLLDSLFQAVAASRS